MYLLFTNRDVIIRLLPHGLRLAEIGVQKGEFSNVLLSTRPKELHLIDPWEFQTDDMYKRDGANVAEDAHLRNMKQVKDTVGRDPRVVIHRGYSNDILPNFRSGNLDAVYVDGNHTYQAVLDDLAASAAAIDDDGILMGHDFCSHWRSQQGGFGVIGAVMEFCKLTGADFFGLTSADGTVDHTTSFSTYFLAKTPSSKMKAALLGSIMESKVGLVNLPLSVVGAYSHSIVTRKDGTKRYVPSFSL